MKVTLIGCGAIGKTLAMHLENEDNIESVCVLDRKKEAVEALEKECHKVRYASNIEDAFEKSDLIVEAASQSAVKEFLPKALEIGKDMVIMSVGAFVDDEFREKCKVMAKQNNCRIYIPSGAVCGIEGICAATIEEVEEIILMTYKPPDAFKGDKYLKRKA